MERTGADILKVTDLTKHFGGLSAVEGLDLVVNAGEILALIGPNGAGKTTVFNLISGFLKPTRGRQIFKGRDITHLKPHEIARRGIVRTFQSNVLFMDKTVFENVLLGFHSQYRRGYFGEIFGTTSYKSERSRIESEAERVIKFMQLTKVKGEVAGNLAHGYQRMLGIAIGLSAQPELLLLDEPVCGMNDEETARMMGLIKELRDRGISILLVEHDMKAVMGNCERIIVINYGRKIAEGTPSEIANNQKVIEAYLGSGDFDD